LRGSSTSKSVVILWVHIKRCRRLGRFIRFERFANGVNGLNGLNGLENGIEEFSVVDDLEFDEEL
ncbi:MAG: hypothetical protein WC117_10605, partial [Sphaerochaetaceae bacterium]